MDSQNNSDVIRSVRIEALNPGYLESDSAYYGSEELVPPGQHLVFDEGVHQKVMRIHEFSSLCVQVTTESNGQPPRVYAGFKQEAPISKKVDEDGSIAYRFEFVEPFKNHLGYASFLISFLEGESLSVPVEVFSSKATFESVKNMLSFIFENDQNIASLCFSQTQVPTGNMRNEKVDLLRKVDMGLRVLESLQKNMVFFKTNPCTQYRKEPVIKKYSPETDHLDERSIDWLTRNTENIEIDLDESQGNIGALPIKIGNAKVYKPIHTTDIYENEVLHSFVVDFFHFLKKVENLNPTDVYEKFAPDIYSFQELNIEWQSHNSGPQSRVNHGKRQLSLVKRSLEKLLPVSRKRKLMPKLTNEVRVRRHYKEVFHYMYDYYVVGEPDWADTSFLSGMKSLYDVYELFTLTHLIRKISLMGGKSVSSIYQDKGVPKPRPADKPNNIYKFELNGSLLTLLYTPVIDFDLNPLFQGLHKGGINAKAFGIGHIEPDFVLIGDERFVVLDAKFSPMRSVVNYSLSDIMTKYGMGLHLRNHRGLDVLPEGVIAIYAKNGEKSGVFTSAFPKSSLTGSLRWSGMLHLPPESKDMENSEINEIILDIT